MANKDRMIKNGEIIIENERKPKMGTGAPIARRVSIDVVTGLRPDSLPVPLTPITSRARPRLTRAKVLMPSEVKDMTREEISRRTTAGLKTMAPVRRERPSRRKLKDQVPRKAEPSTTGKETYVSLRLEARDGEIQVVGVKQVEGALTHAKKVKSGLVYEVVRRGKRIAMGQIPDYGQKRSFPHPDPKPGQEGHAISELPTVRFTARIPAKEFSATSIKQFDISLMRVKEMVRKDVVDTIPLREQMRNELRDVATMKRIKEDKLPRPVARQLKSVLRKL
jgi:hypothetical protein